MKARTSETKRWDLYRVLAEPIRLRILALTTEDALTIGELAELLVESQPNVSRHAASLKAASLVTIKKEGTRTLVQMSEDAASDVVIADALESGRALCEEDGSMRLVPSVLRRREDSVADYFSKPRPDEHGAELLTYAIAFMSLLPNRYRAIDVGTGTGLMLDVLSPAFSEVIAIDSSEAQLDRARARAKAHGYTNVQFVLGSVADKALSDRFEGLGNLVFASRVLHHAARPREFVASLARMCASCSEGNAYGGGRMIIVDYLKHQHEAMREQADVWLGFDEKELSAFAKKAGLVDGQVTRIPSPSRGVDAHLQWRVLTGRRPPGMIVKAGKDSPARLTNSKYVEKDAR